ncbi:hypothetical protein GOP47_0010864 [Adiantum capillus-veneris]|uniref:Orn/DAP/Arg decarboxylase 2 N-terminal domain-containing protein n=1 Tax=Adiantum capillus-veneris TaxID=13818 RepID=A0A9D4ZGS2_ADICA|nr:hypothetical protein GOP47_0010864 [Adiantum capillus-veneris]
MGILLQLEDVVDTQFGSTKGFEGVEKRLQLEFCPSLLCDGKGLRALSRTEIEQILTVAKCTIVSELSNAEVDSYVLSESSLFIYPFKLVIKTCGTTKLLNAVPIVLNAASRLSLKVKCCKYTRSSFLFPEEQPYPHGTFNQEVEYLEGVFGKLGFGSKAYVLGDPCKRQNWHIYVASVVDCDGTLMTALPTYTLELCMTNLDRTKAASFYRENCYNAADMTQKSGIAMLLPKSEICEFVFDPCGYSMNSVERDAVSTIHVTPEEGFSYASFEAMGYNPSEVNFQVLIDDVLSCFRPATFSVAVHVSSVASVLSKSPIWGASVLPYGYVCDNYSMERLPGGGVVYFHTFAEQKAGFQSAISKLPSQFECLKPMKSEILKNRPEDVVSNIYLCLKETSYFCSGLALEHLLSAIDPVLVGPKSEDLDNLIKKQIVSSKMEDAFYVLDVGVVLRLWRTWKLAMPRVHPFYAVKCNSDVPLLALLSVLGAGFDVASKAELDLVRSLGIGGDRVIFANPCKMPSHILHAANNDVHLTTFDSEGELYKLHKLNPQAEVVLRIRVCDAGARCPLGVKYGAEMDDCESLLAVAKNLGLKVVGIAFHVGSGASDPSSFAQGIAQARLLFDTAKAMGLTSLRLLDIGGGFVSDGGLGVSFSAAAASINDAIEKYFPPGLGVTVIAEPGRFFAEESFTLAAQVFGSRVRQKDGSKVAEYWINDGIYGSMNCLLYDHATLSVRSLQMCSGKDFISSNDGCQSTIFGPTCDGLDTVVQNAWLPLMDCGDWLVFPRMGAYTKAAASSFNGFDISGIQTICVCSTTS